MIAGVTAAVDRLPFGHARLEPVILSRLYERDITSMNAGPFRQWIKTEVRHYVVEGIRDHQFAVDWHHPRIEPGMKMPG